MKAIGYLLIGMAVFLYYEGFKGRALPDVATDIADISKATITLDTETIMEVVGREGTIVDGGSASESFPQGSGFGVPGAKALPAIGGGAGASVNGIKTLAKARQLGQAAKGYRLGATGPTYYDCSGLLWRAMKDTGVYTGPRFTSHTFRLQLANRITEVSAPAAGDILSWIGHMAIAESPTTCYHAASPKSGIKSANIPGLVNALRSRYGGVRYYRLND